MSDLWQVAVDAPLSDALTYKAGDLPIARGQLVQVPLGKRKSRGVVFGPAPAPKTEMELKSIAAIESQYPPLDEQMLPWLEWMSMLVSMTFAATAPRLGIIIPNP